MHTPLTPELWTQLQQLLPDGVMTDSPDIRAQYSHDETEDWSFPPDCVALPRSVEEVSVLMAFAYEHGIPVTPIGGQTGLSGGALSVHGGIGLSVKHLNRIIEIDEDNLQVTVEPAVITQVLRDTVAEKGLMYPVDPSSQGSCTIGGNVAENAGGARAVKYGVTKDYVLNLEVVLPNGEVIWTGANTLKNATGYNLTQLLVGSEGTLGIITKIVLKLIPAQPHNILMLVPFHQADQACQAVAAIFKAGVVPSALEFMERDALLWSMRYTEGQGISVPDHIQAHLLIEVDGHYPDVLMLEAEKIMQVVESYAIDDIWFADTAEQKNTLWKMRRAIGEAVKSNSVYKEEDTVVPRYQLPKLLQGIKAIGQKYGFESVCYGHAGDGNLHVNIVKESMTDAQWQTEVPKGIEEIFKLTVQLGGTLSGEHGIGWVQRDYMPLAFSRTSLDLMWGIKKHFDPKGIMNPAKVFPSTYFE